LRKKKNIFEIGWRSWVKDNEDVKIISGNGKNEKNDGKGKREKKIK
jgi:hypothetical protein